MARPSPSEKVAREKRREEREKIRAAVQERDAEIHVRVQAIADGALVKPSSGPPSLNEIYDKLRAAYQLAMTTEQPGHAVTAAMAMGKLAGFVVERSAVAVGSPREFSMEDTEQTIKAKLTDRYGPERAGRVIRMVQQMRAVMRGDDPEPPLIEGNTDG
jgi:hypothetical protein